MGGGTLMDNGIHMLDLTRLLLGDVEELNALVSEGVWKVSGCEDNAFLLLRSGNGAVASLHSSWTEWRGYRFWIGAYGDRGTAWAYYAPMASLVVRLDRPGGSGKRQFQFYPWLNLREKFRGWQTTVVQTFREELRDFQRLIDGEDRLLAGGFDGFRAVEMAVAARKSTSDGKPIRLCDPF